MSEKGVLTEKEIEKRIKNEIKNYVVSIAAVLIGRKLILRRPNYEKIVNDIYNFMFLYTISDILEKYFGIPRLAVLFFLVIYLLLVHPFIRTSKNSKKYTNNTIKKNIAKISSIILLRRFIFENIYEKDMYSLLAFLESRSFIIDIITEYTGEYAGTIILVFLLFTLTI